MASQEEPDVAPYVDPVVEAYKKDVDRTLLRENLKLTVEQRVHKLQSFLNFFRQIHGAAWKGR